MQKMDSIEKTLNYKTGKITLAGGIATIDIPAGFKMLESEEANFVLTEMWGNLKSEDVPLGLLFPANGGATVGDSYAFIIYYEALGHVKDKDADDINYDDMLNDLKESQVEANKLRKAAGLETLDLVGWASKPFYDKEKKLLHWAKEIKVETEEEHTLNYDIRILGRKGVLTLQALSYMSMLDTVKQDIPKVLDMVSFTPGNTYADFDSKTDDIAAWTIGGLVAGKVLAKAGILALILKNIKLVIIGVVALGGGIWKWVTSRRRRKEEELAYETAPAETNDNPPTA